MNVTSSASDSSSEVELYFSSLNRGADDRELEVGDAGRGIQGVKGQCGPGGSIGAVASVLSAEAASGDRVKWSIWVGICCCWSRSVLPGILSAVPPFLPEVVSFLVGLILMGRLSPSDSPLLLVILVLVDIL